MTQEEIYKLDTRAGCHAQSFYKLSKICAFAETKEIYDGKVALAKWHFTQCVFYQRQSNEANKNLLTQGWENYTHPKTPDWEAPAFKFSDV